MDNFFRLCIAIFSFAALNFANAQAAPKINNGKAVVMGSLRGGSLGAASGINYQTGRHGLTADYHQPVRRMPSANDPVHRLPANDPVHRLPAKAKTPVSGLARGIKGFLKSPVGKANIALIVGAWALEGILEEAGVFKEDDDYYIIDLNHELEIEGQWNTHPQGLHKSYPSVKSYISDITHCDEDYYKPCTSTLSNSGKEIYVRGKSQRGFWILYHVGECPVDAVLTGSGCVSAQKRPLTDDYIDNLNFSNWTPPTNVPKSAVEQVYPYISPADTTIELAPITVTAPQETVTMPDGTVKETTKKETISISNPNTDPALVVSTQTTTNTYQNGQMTGSETTTTTTDATAATPTESAPAPEQIIDCDLVPTLCATQKEQLENDKKRDEWLKEMPDEIVPPLPSIIDNPIELQPFEIKLGSKTCPSPKKINLSFTSVVLPLDIICEYAKNLRIFILMAAFILAARIVINGVK